MQLSIRAPCSTIPEQWPVTDRSNKHRPIIPAETVLNYFKCLSYVRKLHIFNRNITALPYKFTIITFLLCNSHTVSSTFILCMCEECPKQSINGAIYTSENKARTVRFTNNSNSLSQVAAVETFLPVNGRNVNTVNYRKPVVRLYDCSRLIFSRINGPNIIVII